MNIYILVEGQSTETDLYPAWLSYLIPELSRVNYFDEVEQNNYYLFSSNGIPSVYDDIINATKDINSTDKYDYFVICLDANSATVNQREDKIVKLLKDEQVNLINTPLKIIVQNRCIETWLLGNIKVYSRNPQNDSQFIEYSDFYNVSQNDPELMNKPDHFRGSISNFHIAYLKAMFRERGKMTYSKSNSKEVQKSSYLKELKKRVSATPHLKSLSTFFEFCEQIRIHFA